MRTIKFRFWGDFGIIDNDDEEERKTMLYGDVFAFDEYEPINDLFKMRDTVVMQYTGLKDSKGVEIYEGDIIKYWYDRDKTGDSRVEFTEAVEFEEMHEYSGWSIHKDLNPEVIGNIYEAQNETKGM